jgi:hypothetical protein
LSAPGTGRGYPIGEESLLADPDSCPADGDHFTSSAVALSAPIATTSLAEKTQISIVQLVTITGRAGADRSSGAPRGERGVPKEQAKAPHSVGGGRSLAFSGGPRNASSS